MMTVSRRRVQLARLERDISESWMRVETDTCPCKSTVGLGDNVA